ncbi:molybdenum cofactor guanylyltransferase [Pirellulaceae bacterium SH501]
MNAYILAGGKSQRFGSCKARVEINGSPSLVRLCSQLRASGLSPWIVSKAKEDFVDMFPSICEAAPAGMLSDREKIDGPLAGVAAALEHCERENKSKCWILNCDLIEWQGIWQESILSLPGTTLDGAYLVMLAAPESSTDDAERRFQPFPGFYDTRSIPHLWAKDVMAKQSVFSWISRFANRCTWVPVGSEFSPRTFNTPDELREMLADRN